MKIKAALLVGSIAMLAGCMNMPTPPSQITGAYTSGLRYENFDCGRLSAEFDSLSRREHQLVVAQEQRLKTSQIQAFWWGFGQGDGVEASELANVKGEREAVRTAMTNKNCLASPLQPTLSVTQAQPQPSQPVGADSGTVERMIRGGSCNPEPRAVLTAKGPGFETYSVACRSGEVAFFRCEFGNCRELK